MTASKTAHGLFDQDQTNGLFQSPLSPEIFPASNVDAFAGLQGAGAGDASVSPDFRMTPPSSVATSIFPPLELSALGSQVSAFFGKNSSVELKLATPGPDLRGGNVAFVSANSTANGGLVVTPDKYLGVSSSSHPTVFKPGSHGGETLVGEKYGSGADSRVTDSADYQLAFHLSNTNLGLTAVSSKNIISNYFEGSFALKSTAGAPDVVRETGTFTGRITILGWNSDSILLQVAGGAGGGGGAPTVDIVISTEDMSKQTSSLPTNTTFTMNTASLPTILGQLIPCFAAGTMLATPSSDVCVEDLRAGDLVLTQAGEAVPIQWIGSRTVACHAHPRPEKVMPVRVRRGAFGPNLPKRDLILSPDHAVFIDGVLIPVCELVNGASVVQEAVHTIRYLHVELPLHDILLAEGLPTESFLDIGNHTQFGEGPDPMPLHPDFAALSWEAACAPLRLHGPEVDAARALLAARAAQPAMAA